MKKTIQFVFVFLLILASALTGCSSVKETVKQEDWRISPTFELPYIGNDGKEHKYVLLGVEGKLGFIVGPYGNEKGEVVDQQPIIAGKGNKYMWHFWGSEEELNGNLKVIGINDKGEEHKILVENGGMPDEEKVWEYPTVGLSPNNGADTHVPSGMEFPTAGLWKLDV